MANGIKTRIQTTACRKFNRERRKHTGSPINVPKVPGAKGTVPIKKPVATKRIARSRNFMARVYNLICRLSSCKPTRRQFPANCHQSVANGATSLSPSVIFRRLLWRWYHIRPAAANSVSAQPPCRHRTPVPDVHAHPGA